MIDPETTGTGVGVALGVGRGDAEAGAATVGGAGWTAGIARAQGARRK